MSVDNNVSFIVPQGEENNRQIFAVSFELVKPIDAITEDQINSLRNSLQEADYNLNIKQEAQNSLLESQFRNLDQGRGPGVVASAGRDRAEKLWDKCEEIAAKHNWKQSFPSGGTGLGLKHSVADFISLAVLPAEERPKIIKNLNQRVYLGWKKITTGKEREIIDNAFAHIPPVAEPKKKATIPPGSLIEIWTAMTSK